MSKYTPYVFEFGSYVLNPPERLLLREGTPVEMPPKVFDLLLALVSRGGHLLEKDELLRTVWEGREAFQLRGRGHAPRGRGDARKVGGVFAPPLRPALLHGVRLRRDGDE
ncbi:MAG TPA: hypothetical protein VHU19_03505 [Pyrinomonadaceae bacterium]|jgi:hypothetical protein|nr:hypothetical protein [Pyrinomonadaceae bacterium]